MNIRKLDCSPGDIDRLTERSEAMRQAIRSALPSSSEGIYLAQCGDEIAGFLALNRFRDEGVMVNVQVGEPHRRKGIGTELIRFADRVIADSPFEHAYCEFTADDGTAEFLTGNGYYRYCSVIDMERDNTPIDGEKLSDPALLEKGIVIRNYTDDDYRAWHNISDVAFFLLRKHLGLTPPYYLPLSEPERKRLEKDRANRYIMTDGGVAVAIGAVRDEWIHLLAVRPDLQARGYGRTIASYLNNQIITKLRPEKVKIAVVNGNPAKRLYERLGFRDTRLSYEYIKYYKPESRPAAPKGYANEEEIVNDLRRYGALREETE